MNNYRKQLGIGLIVPGIKFLRDLNYEKETCSFGDLASVIKDVVNIPIVQRDITYYTAKEKDIKEMVDLVNQIMKHFKWEAEFSDCDDRAKFVSALFSILFGFNTCGELYCELTSLKTGKKYLHWANIIITSEGDLILYDVDNGGLTKDIEDSFSMGKHTYSFRSARF